MSDLYGLLSIGVLICASTISCAADEVSTANFFETKVAPLLSEKCLGCHSHDARTMEGGLALDSKAGWSIGGDRGTAITPGNSAGSLLISAILYENPDLQMPPDEKLSEAEIAIFREWVNSGAIDPRKVIASDVSDTDWWSLKPLVAPDVPGDGHPIDAFIRDRLSKEGIEYAPQTDRSSLARRLHVDLHGLLPTPEEAKAFAEDQASDADVKLINQLLGSPRYGERWARHWLDVIHFADSHGCEHDVKRPNAWRFRDYVIQRLNADVPWDRFIREQLAADALYPNEPQLTAGLGFIAAGPLELSRASTAPVTFDYLDRDDMVTQTMAAFVSTTANCARCHTHKFDPITQDDYYSLQAVFAGVGKGDIEFEPSAEVLNHRREIEELLTATETNAAEILLQPKYAEIVKKWEADRQAKPVEWTVLTPEVFLSSGGATLTLQPDNSVFASGVVPDDERYTVTSVVDISRLSAIRIEALKDDRLPENGPGRASNGNLHLSEFEAQWFAAGSNTAVTPRISLASADFDQEGWTSSQAIDGDNKTGWAIYPNVNESHHIVFELDQPIELATGGRLAVTLKHSYPPKHIIGRFRVSVTASDGHLARPLSGQARQALLKPAEQRTDAEAAAIAAEALEPFSKSELAKLPAKDVVYGASSSWSHASKLAAPQKPKVVHLLRRGAFDRPVHEVSPGAIQSILNLKSRFDVADPNQEALRRVALAEWLAHPDNPLTWRSIVNRVWHYHFGQGLCDTPNDFGRMGGVPTHPELLDWLAVWFRDEAKGSLKELHRLILTSETWQQSSLVAMNMKDQDNRFLWRMNRQRMDAEVFRDSILSLGGRLDFTMGGPGVEQFTKHKGPQATPELNYKTYDWNSPGATRRSIYRVVWRGIPDPFMEVMDFPDLGLLAPKRGQSISSLQSLAMYNNDFILLGSEWFAQRLQSEHEELDKQVARAAELAWLRRLENDEQQALILYAKTHGLSALCRVLINSNEFLFVD